MGPYDPQRQVRRVRLATHAGSQSRTCILYLPTLKPALLSLCSVVRSADTRVPVVLYALSSEDRTRDMFFGALT